MHAIDMGNISSTTIWPPVVCHRINSPIIARPGPYPVDIPIAVPAVSQLTVGLTPNLAQTCLLCGYAVLCQEQDVIGECVIM